jgi:hypothetical protein
MREVYQIYDSEAKKVDGIIRGDKPNTRRKHGSRDFGIEITKAWRWQGQGG